MGRRVPRRPYPATDAARAHLTTRWQAPHPTRPQPPPSASPRRAPPRPSPPKRPAQRPHGATSHASDPSPRCDGLNKRPAEAGRWIQAKRGRTYTSPDGHRAIQLSMGERVRLGRNQLLRNPDATFTPVRSGMVATITALTRGGITVDLGADHIGDGPARITLPLSYIGEHLEYGYARTADSAQSTTIDHACSPHRLRQPETRLRRPHPRRHLHPHLRHTRQRLARHPRAFAPPTPPPSTKAPTPPDSATTCPPPSWRSSLKRNRFGPASQHRRPPPQRTPEGGAAPTRRWRWSHCRPSRPLWTTRRRRPHPRRSGSRAAGASPLARPAARPATPGRRPE